MRVRIHRGTRQIGGTCVELEADGESILLDLGLPLDAGSDPGALLPNVPGLKGAGHHLRALLVSHGHRDHWGLIPHIQSDIPIAMGAATARILHASAPFIPEPFTPKVTFELADRKILSIGPFNITPYLVDHSAFDAYALLIEAYGRRLFYSGDIRAHGRKSVLFERLVTRPPLGVNVMLMEGSTLGRLGPDSRFDTEAEIEQHFVERFSAAPGFIAVATSAQNVDRIVSIYRACKRTDRTLLLDLYALEILKATGNPNIPGVGWPNLRVYVPEYQRRQIVRAKRFDLIDPYKAHRVYADDLPATGTKAVMLFRPAMMADVDKAGLWLDGRMIWSQWEGYLKEGVGLRLKADLVQRSVPFEVIHTSGHAAIADLRRLSGAIRPEALVPIHTFEGDSFSRYFENVVRRADGEWWDAE